MNKRRTHFNVGNIVNQEGASKDIVVRMLTKEHVRDMLIGCGTIMVGTIYLIVTMFDNGVFAFSDAELNTMIELGIIDGKHGKELAKAENNAVKSRM